MTVSIAVVGMGARGLSILERIAAMRPERRLVLEVVDPGPPGPGVHREDQPDHLLLNTVAGQITVFRHDDPAASDAGVEGPSLAEWAGVPRDAYLPRRMLGAYLRFAFERLCAAMPSGVRVIVREAVVRDAERRDDGSWSLALSDGRDIRADFVVLATGHGSLRPTAVDAAARAFVAAHRARNPALDWLRSCYPLAALDTIPPKARVGVRGMGLAAVDTVIALTEGRGGRFVEAGAGELRYVPSGAEPTLVLWSRHGRPFWPRARNEKSPHDVHRPIVFDRGRVEAMRRLGPRDFAADYVPLLEAEIRHAADRIDPSASIAHVRDLLRAPSRVDTMPSAERQEALRAFFVAEERRSEIGNMSDAVKAATDAIRDLRNEIRETVEHGGLTPESHRAFVESYAPLLHVMSAGPPALRARQWRALLACGILSLGPIAPDVRPDDEAAAFVLEGADDERQECDVIVGASVDVFLPGRDASPLTGRLLERGYGRPFRNGDYHPGGWDIDRSGRLRDARGEVIGNLCAVGNPTEGPHYFTNMLPAPGLPSRITGDAQRVVEALDEWLASVPPLDRWDETEEHAA